MPRINVGAAPFRYGLAILVSAIAVVVGQLPLFENLQFGVLLFAVVLASWYAGAGPGLLAAVVSGLALEFFFLPPIYSLAISSAEDVTRLGIFMLAAVIVSVTALKMAPWPTPHVAAPSASAELEPARARAAVAFEHLAQSLPDQALFLLDSQGTVVSWSRAAEHLTGFAAQDIVHQHFRFLYPVSVWPDGKPVFALQAAAAHEAGHEEEVMLERRNGAHFRARLSLKALWSTAAGSLRQGSEPATAGVELCGFLVRVYATDAAQV